MKISYSALVKNPRRKTAPYYGRVRQDGREKFIEAGLAVPDELMAKLLTVDTPSLLSHGYTYSPVSGDANLPGTMTDGFLTSGAGSMGDVVDFLDFFVAIGVTP